MAINKIQLINSIDKYRYGKYTYIMIIWYIINYDICNLEFISYDSNKIIISIKDSNKHNIYITYNINNNNKLSINFYICECSMCVKNKKIQQFNNIINKYINDNKLNELEDIGYLKLDNIINSALYNFISFINNNSYIS